MGLEISGSDIFDTPQDLLPPPPQAAPPPRATQPTQNVFGGLSFDPAPSAGNTGAAAEEVPEGDLFSFAVNATEQRMKEGVGKPGEARQVSEIMPDSMIEISAELYVELLEGVIQVGCVWISGNENGKYMFDKVFKEKYKEISAKIMRHQNINVTPMQLFTLATIFLVFGPAKNAFIDRKKRISAENFKKKAATRSLVPGEQVQMDLPGMEKVEIGRKFFQVDGNGMYEKTPTGQYCKQSEREQAPAELLPFLRDFFSKNDKWPNAQQVKAYLNQ